MITHEEARELVNKIYVHTDWETKDKLLAYISQQEKKDELLGLYQTYHYEPSEINQRIKTLEKELGEMK